MLRELEVEPGIVLGFGGTNARYGEVENNDIVGFQSYSTPETPQEFFDWMARQVLEASDSGHEWLVAGFPGPVSPDGKVVGPLANVPGLSRDRYSLVDELQASDGAVGRLLGEGFRLIAVNDGELAAQAAASHIGDHKFSKTAALILGTGVGAGLVIRDPDFSIVHRADRSNPLEIGHISLSGDPEDTFENSVSGPALARDYEIDAKYMPADHPAWERVGRTVGQMAALLGLMSGVELVVPCGGVGAGGSEKYKSYLDDLIMQHKQEGNGTQKLFLPEIVPVPVAEAQVFELFGGIGVMRDFATR